jgi:hypothetical protein
VFTIQYARDPVYSDETGNTISLIVKFFELDTELPFGATPFDDMSYGVELFYRAKAGEYGPVGPYVPPPPPPETPTTEGAQTL